MDLFFRGWAREKCRRIRLAVMDMWKPFRNSTLKAGNAPQAGILYDKFHVLKHLSEALDKVRKSEYARLSGKDRRFIKGQKYTLLSHRANLTPRGTSVVEGAVQGQQAAEHGLPAQGDRSANCGTTSGKVGHGASSSNWRVGPEVAAPQAVREVRPDGRGALGRDRVAIATRRTRCPWASSKDSTTRSASSNDGPTAFETRSTSASRSSPACCRKSEIGPKLPTRQPEDPKVIMGAMITERELIEKSRSGDNEPSRPSCPVMRTGYTGSPRASASERPPKPTTFIKKLSSPPTRSCAASAATPISAPGSTGSPPTSASCAAAGRSGSPLFLCSTSRTTTKMARLTNSPTGSRRRRRPPARGTGPPGRPGAGQPAHGVPDGGHAPRHRGLLQREDRGDLGARLGRRQIPGSSRKAFLRDRFESAFGADESFPAKRHPKRMRSDKAAQ